LVDRWRCGQLFEGIKANHLQMDIRRQIEKIQGWQV